MSESVSTPNFRDLYRQLTPEVNSFKPDGHIRGRQAEGSQEVELYRHGMFSVSSLKEGAAEQRAAKWQMAATAIKHAVAREYGTDRADQVFASLRGQGRADPEKELLWSDLPRLHELLTGPTPFKSVRTENQQRQAQLYAAGKSGACGPVDCSPKAMQLMDTLFGRELSASELRGLAGLPERCGIKVQVSGDDPELKQPASDGLLISLDSAHRVGVSRAQVTVYRSKDGALKLFQSHFDKRNADAGEIAHLGACAITRMVDTAHKLQIALIHNFSTGAYKGYRGYNGYYTWARCGGNTTLAQGSYFVRPEDRYRANDFHTNLRASTDPVIQELVAKGHTLELQDFMQTQVGRDFWKEHGFPLYQEFDLTPGSKTDKTLKAYAVPNSCFAPEQ